jgi:transposase-like protein
MGNSRRQWSGEEILKVLKRYLVERVELSGVCEEFGVHPSQVYRWQAQMFSEGAAVFERRRTKREKKADKKAEQRAARLEAKLQSKNEVLSELMEEHVKLKKSLGEI